MVLINAELARRAASGDITALRRRVDPVAGPRHRSKLRTWGGVGAAVAGVLLVQQRCDSASMSLQRALPAFRCSAGTAGRAPRSAKVLCGPRGGRLGAPGRSAGGTVNGDPLAIEAGPLGAFDVGPVYVFHGAPENEHVSTAGRRSGRLHEAEEPGGRPAGGMESVPIRSRPGRALSVVLLDVRRWHRGRRSGSAA